MIYARIINWMKSLPDENYSDIILVYFDLYLIYEQEEKYLEAEEVLTSIIDVAQIRPEECKEELADAYQLLGLIYYRQKRCQEAEALLRMSLMHEERYESVAFVCVVLGMMCTESHRLVEGENMFLRAIEIIKELPDAHKLLAMLELILEENGERQLGYC